MAAVAQASADALAGPDRTAATQRLRLIAPNQLAAHNTIDSLWVSYQGNVYDVTEFAPDHPGGDDLVLEYAGRDIEEIMNDAVSHSHSDSAFEMLHEYLIGKLPTTQEEHATLASGVQDFTGKDKDVVITADFSPSDTDLAADFQKHAFLDLERPLIMQVLRAKFSKEFYLQQVHSPRHLKESARLFGPSYLEVLTRTQWWVVPLFWGPITAAIFYRSLTQFAHTYAATRTASDVVASAASSAIPAPSAMASVVVGGLRDLLHKAAPGVIEATATSAPAARITVDALLSSSACFVTGVVVWTILEYVLHRFLFHVDDYLPDHPVFLTLHFLLHGIHHYLPMDRLRLVMPPLLFAALSYPFTRLGYALFPPAIANGIIAGAFGMYICYDVMHYSLHHHRLPAYLREMKAYHLAHHYKNYEEGFGVTSKLWDIVFGTGFSAPPLDQKTK